MKILFLGNSITRHSFKPEIGWEHDWGMAASRPENDYAHVLCRMLEEKGKHIICKAENISFFETDPGHASIERLFPLRDFGADIVVIRIGENVSDEKAERFGKYLPSLIDFFKDSASRPEVFTVASFWKKDEVERATEKAARKCGVSFISLSEFQSEEYEAVGQFEHTGVAAHPSDKGMKAIAEKIYAAIEEKGLLSAPSVPALYDENDENAYYRVTVDGREIKCRSCRVSAYPFNTVWPGHQRPVSQTETASFISFDMEAPTDVAVTLPRRPSETVIRPLSAGIACEVYGDTAYFTIKKPGQYTFEADGRCGALHIFANKKETFDTERATYKFEAGVHDAGRLTLKSNESVYIAPGAVVYGEITASDCENIRIFGRGILDGSKLERGQPGCEIGSSGLITFSRCKGVSIDGIILRDSCLWTVTAINCEEVDFRNVKLIGMWRYNSDGFDFVNSRNVRVSDCFLRTFDDSIVLKGLRLDEERIGEKMNMENYLIESCVVWCDWGGALEIGAETVADEYKNIVFRNCDIIRTDQGALRVHSGDRAEIHDVLYEDIRIEYSRHDRKAVYQESDDMEYDPGTEPAHMPFIKDWMYCGVWTKDNIPGDVHDITYRNIAVHKDEEVPMPYITLDGYDETHRIHGVTIENVSVNGQPVVPAVFTNEYVSGVRINDIHKNG